MRCCCLLITALLGAPSLAAAQELRFFAGAGGGVTSVPRAGDAGCGGKPDEMIGFSGEVRAGVRTGALEVAVRAARVFQGAHTAYDCFYPPMGIHTSFEYEDLDDVATTLDANVWYSVLPGGMLKAGVEVGIVPDHSVYAGAGAALGIARNRLRLELTGRMHRIEYTEVVNEWNDVPVREISRTDKTETLPGFATRIVVILP